MRTVAKMRSVVRYDINFPAGRLGARGNGTEYSRTPEVWPRRLIGRSQLGIESKVWISLDPIELQCQFICQFSFELGKLGPVSSVHD